MNRKNRLPRHKQPTTNFVIMSHDLSHFTKEYTPPAPTIEWPSFLTKKRIAVINQLLSEKMCNDRPYLRPHYSLRHLASEVDIPSYQLSAYLNKIRRMTYPEFINQYRIEYCRQLIEKDGYDHYNLRGLAKICGFGNRNTLTTMFQKYTGYTPSAYIKLVRAGR